MPKGQLWRGIAGLLGVFAGLCAIFALVVTVIEAWQEYVQARWPETAARIENCTMHQSSTGRRDRYYIDCYLSYVVDDQRFGLRAYSSRVPAATVWQYPANQIGPLQEWVDAHPQGTPAVVRYDPANHRKAVLAATDMPRGGTHTPNNLKLLAFFAAMCAVFLGIVRITRPKSGALGGEMA
jgi:hypothetical protein